MWYYAGEYDRAVSQCRRALELNPSFALAHLWAGQAYEMLGRTDQALSALRRAVELSDEGAIFVAALARTLAVRGERGDPSGCWHASRRVAPPYPTRSRGYMPPSVLRVDPQVAELRNDPDVRELLARMRL